MNVLPRSSVFPTAIDGPERRPPTRTTVQQTDVDA